MKYVTLIRRALEHANNRISLEELLRSIDALDKSVPTLEELNSAFVVVQETGRFPDYDFAPVTIDAYDHAIAAYRKWVSQKLENYGMTHDAQKTAVEAYMKFRK
jgi:hypothetical protein